MMGEGEELLGYWKAESIFPACKCSLFLCADLWPTVYGNSLVIQSARLYLVYF